MKHLLSFLTIILALGLILTVFPKPVHAAPACGFDPKTVAVGGTVGIIVTEMPGTNTARLYTFGSPTITLGIVDGGSGTGGNTFTIPSSAVSPEYQVRVQPASGAEVTCSGGNLTITGTSTGTGTGSTFIGTITPPGGIPTTGGDPSSFVAGVIRSFISLLLIVAFIVFFIWTIFAGIRFVTGGGDPKTVSSAWAHIYWGLIGMVVVVGSFAIIKLVETFFSVNIISGGFTLPTI